MSTMTDTLPTGQEYMASRRRHFTELLEGAESDDMDRREEATEELDSMALSVEIEKHVVIVLGTGGPHDELDVTLRNGAVSSVAYHYYWGSQRFETPVYSGDALYTYAENLAEMYADTDL